jgi:hypothetical protein
MHFDETDGMLHLRFREILHSIYAPQVGYSIFHPVKFEQTIAHQHVPLLQESLIDGTTVPILLCLHVLITYDIFTNLWTAFYRLFKTLTTV